MSEQFTLASKILFSGMGLHTGTASQVEMRPACANTGLVFALDGKRLPARAENVSACDRSTSLGLGDWQIRTVEHLLSALHGMGVDNAEIELQGEEMPIIDGSAFTFAEQIHQVGLHGLGAPRKVLEIREPLLVKVGDGYLSALPYDGCRITCITDYGRPHAGPQTADLLLEPGVYLRELAPARTFGFQEEVEALLARGLALGGTLDNALVISDQGPSTPLRFPEELARHKALDMVGDLILCGRRLKGHFIGFKPSHRLNTEMAKTLVKLYE